MKKMTVLLREFTPCPQGYGIMPGALPSDIEIMDKIIELLPKKKKYIKHFTTTIFETNIKLPFYIPQFDKTLKIPQGTLKLYLVLYYQ